MTKPCDICGHTGFVACIRVCCGCKITREHPYCMKVIHLGDPDEWVCEECASGDQIPSTKTVPNRDAVNTAIRSNIRKPPRNTKVQYISPEEAMVLESGAQKKNISSPSKLNVSCRPTLNITPLPRVEANRSTVVSPKFSLKPNFHDRPPGFTKPRSTRSPPNTSRSKDTEKHVQKQLDRQDSPVAIRPPATKAQTSNAATTDRNKGFARQVYKETFTRTPLHIESVPKSNAERVVENSGHASMQSVQHVLAKTSDKGPVRQLQGDTSAGTTLHPENIPKSNAEMVTGKSGSTSVQVVQSLTAVNSDKDPVRKPKRDPRMALHLERTRKSNSEIVIGISEDASVKHLPVASSGRESMGVVLELDRYLLNHPAEFPTWRGRFKITHHDDVLRCRSFDGIQAHPPCKVHRKVYNISKQFPETIQFELLPRLDVWVTLFKDDVPGTLDIGLYFLSSKSNSLLNYLDENDMLLRSQIDGVELLVFSSRHLHEDSQKINKELYLWGIFRCSDNTVEAPRGQSGEDMEIDMLGGCEVGTIDKVVLKPSEDPRPVPELTPVKLEALDDTDPVRPLASSDLQNESEFERELQRSFDRFVMLEQLKVKEEVESPRRTR
ncbi:hypothetical protein RND81_02G039700 [Saponaria officinalis]|uniref:AIPP2-like SPOC-like domain-containing protein n=1 Tax=Saponaria officinalis TaxID=3572 RepID=A0AAW1MPP3_SAPOF